MPFKGRGYSAEFELDVNNNILSQLKDVRVIFDVGSRDDVNYFDVKPNAKFHLFEPNPDYFAQLLPKIEGRKNSYANNFGLGDEIGEFPYDDGRQGFSGGEQGILANHHIYPVTTIDWYVKEHKIKRIDFLKTDTEGFDLKVLTGCGDMLPEIRYIEFEHWDNVNDYRKLLEPLGFELILVGFRNVLCLNKNLVDETERDRLKAWLIEQDYTE